MSAGDALREGVAHFAVKSIGLSRVNGRKPCTLLDAARHNLREIQAEQGAVGRIDSNRTRQNLTLAGPATAADVQALAVSLLASVDTSRLKRDHCQAIEAVFSLPLRISIDAASHFTHCLQWLAGAMALSVLSAVVHHDEATQHLHVLLLPLKDGRHVGGAPIARPELKRLRDSFFTQVAGPAGLTRDTAKVRGTVKQWAVAAVLRRCESLGLPSMNGPLWPVLMTAIERDPTGAMLALNIDLNSIRPADDTPPIERQASPMGLVQSPIGLQKEGAKPQALSCVGLHLHTTPEPPAKAIGSLPELWAVVGNCSRWTAPKAERLRVAKAAMQSALKRSQWLKKNRSSVVRIDEDGLTRERDEYVHDLSAWD
jgi:Plasmid recombination enzyme